MKDLVDNRKRISLGQKAKLATEVVKQNGVLWTRSDGEQHGVVIE